QWTACIRQACAVRRPPPAGTTAIPCARGLCACRPHHPRFAARRDDEDMDAVDEVDPIVQWPADCDRQVQFLVDLADETILDRFSRFELAVRKLPLVALVFQKDKKSVVLDHAFYRYREARRQTIGHVAIPKVRLRLRTAI